MTYDRFTAVPRRWFSWGFRVLEGSTPIAEIDLVIVLWKREADSDNAGAAA